MNVFIYLFEFKIKEISTHKKSNKKSFPIFCFPKSIILSVRVCFYFYKNLNLPKNLNENFLLIDFETRVTKNEEIGKTRRREREKKRSLIEDIEQ